MGAFQMHDFLMNMKVVHHAAVNEPNSVMPIGLCLSKASLRTWNRLCLTELLLKW